MDGVSLEYRDVIGSLRYAAARPDTRGMKKVLLSVCLGADSTVVAQVHDDTMTRPEDVQSIYDALRGRHGGSYREPGGGSGGRPAREARTYGDTRAWAGAGVARGVHRQAGDEPSGDGCPGAWLSRYPSTRGSPAPDGVAHRILECVGL